MEEYGTVCTTLHHIAHCGVMQYRVMLHYTFLCAISHLSALRVVVARAAIVDDTIAYSVTLHCITLSYVVLRAQ